MKQKGARIAGRMPLAGAAVALSSVALALSIPAAGAATPTADPTAGASAKKRAKPVPKRALKALKALERLEPRAQLRWPESFGGLWLARGKVFIAFTQRAGNRVRKLGRKFPDRRPLRAVRVNDSLSALRQQQAQMIADRELDLVTITDPGSGRAPREPARRVPLSYALEIDVKRNTVVAIVHRAVTQEIVAAFAQRYGAEVLVEFGPPPEPHSLFVCTGRDFCPPNLRAGLKANNPVSFCTTAFNVTYPSGNTTVDGLLSAAHCGDPVDDGLPDPDPLGDRFHGGYMYGEVVAEQQSGRVDAELHSVVGLIENSAPWSALAPWIWLSFATSKAPVSGVGTYAGLPIGAKICKSGVMTEATCGEVLSKTFSFDGYVSNAIDFIETDYCSIPGDSGAPVYTTFAPFIKLKFKIAQKAEISLISRKAQGVHSGGAKDTACNDPEYYAIFGHIEFIQDALPVTITTAP